MPVTPQDEVASRGRHEIRAEVKFLRAENLIHES
jgi:hypothetical protein